MKIILLIITFEQVFTYFTNVLQQCTCNGLTKDERLLSPYCSSSGSSNSCSKLENQDKCLANYPNMNCVWTKGACTEFTTCSAIKVDYPSDCRKQLFGICSYDPDTPMNQDTTFNCSDTVYSKCSTLKSDSQCFGAFETRYKMCYWSNNSCTTIDTEKCKSFPNAKACQHYDCFWDINRCREKKCSDYKTQELCTHVSTEFSQGHDVCSWNTEASTCDTMDSTQSLTAETCFTGSLYTYQWKQFYHSCVKCSTTQNVTTISKYFNATYCGLSYLDYNYAACAPAIQTSYNVKVVINILIIFTNGTYIYADDISIFIFEQITIIYENNTILLLNGTYCYDNGTVLEPDGTLVDHSCVTDLDKHYTGYFSLSGIFTEYPEKIVPIPTGERIMIIFSKGTYFQVSKIILMKVYINLKITIIYPDKSYRYPVGDFCYNNLTLVLANSTVIPNGCADKSVDILFKGYYDTNNNFVDYGFAVPNPYFIDYVEEIFIIILMDGTQITTTNIYIYVNVTIIFQNNTVILPDSSFCFTNGTRRYSDGTLKDNVCSKSVDIYYYGYYKEDIYYGFDGEVKSVDNYKGVVEETFDTTIIFTNGTYVVTQEIVEIELYMTLEVTIIYPNNTVVNPNRTICTPDGTIIEPDGTTFENACFQRKESYFSGYYNTQGYYIQYEKPVPNPSTYKTTVIFQNGTKIETTNVTIYENVTIIYKNSTVVQPNGTIVYYNGTIKDTDGTTYTSSKSTYVDRSVYYSGYYSESGTYNQYSSSSTYGYYYGYNYYDSSCCYSQSGSSSSSSQSYSSSQYSSSSHQSSSQSTTIVNTTYINEQIVTESDERSKLFPLGAEAQCRCKDYSASTCTSVGYCQYNYGTCMEKYCSEFLTKSDCTRWALLSGCEWRNSYCQTYTTCQGKPVEYMSDCIKMGRYTCTIPSSYSLKNPSRKGNFECSALSFVSSCSSYGSQSECYQYAISPTNRCIWKSGYCQDSKIYCQGLPEVACILFGCNYDNGRCSEMQCQYLKREEQCNIAGDYFQSKQVCQWYNGKCYNAENIYSVDEVSCAVISLGTRVIDEFGGCSQCLSSITTYNQMLSITIGIILSIMI